MPPGEVVKLHAEVHAFNENSSYRSPRLLRVDKDLAPIASSHSVKDGELGADL